MTGKQVIPNLNEFSAQRPPTNGYTGTRPIVPSLPPSKVTMGMPLQSQINPSNLTPSLPTAPPTQISRPIMSVNAVTSSHSNTLGMRPVAAYMQTPPNLQQNGVWTGQPPIGGTLAYPGGPVYTTSGGQSQLQQPIRPNSMTANSVQGNTPNVTTMP